ncbi:MAG: methyltransferase domain-containing protein [Actinomycetota bacterium]
MDERVPTEPGRHHERDGGGDWDVDRFNRWGARYDRSLFQPLFFARVHLMITAALSPTAGERIIDVGCGTGSLTLRISSVAGSRATGVDPAPAMVRAARRKRRAERTTFAVGAAEALPFSDSIFDAAVSSVSAHHWHDPGAGFRELARVVRPGGRLVVADCTDFGPIVGVLRALGRVPRDHHQGWDPAHLGRLAYVAGFHRVRVRHRRMLGGRIIVLAARR